MDYKVGDKIEYAVASGERRIVKVTYKDEDIKNGRPGFEGVVMEGRLIAENVWGYDEQITRVL